MNASNAQPLAGVRVVEIGTSVAAPYAGWILATLGAQVLKVERPDGGDDARHWGVALADGSSPYFQAFNRDKLGVTIDLSDDREREWLVSRCVEQTDVVIQNMRPGRVESKGLDATSLRARNPRLIYCNMGAFGPVGPLKDRPGYDPLMQASGGLMSVTGEPNRPPVRVGTSIVDMGTGMWTVIGVLCALKRREETGNGMVVDASLYETALGWMTHQSAGAQATGVDPEPRGSGMRGIAPYQVYPCSDGYLMVAAANDRLFVRLADALGHPEWPSDARFESNRARISNLDDLNAALEPVFASNTRDHWQRVLEDAGVPTAPVRTTFEMMAHAQTEALGILRTVGDNPLKVMELPLSFNGERPLTRTLAPELGQHNAQLKDSQ